VYYIAVVLIITGYESENAAFADADAIHNDV
jgi:hypothetical protein